MAKIIPDSMFTELKNHTGNYVYYTVAGRVYARKYVKPHNPRSILQQANRSLFKEAMALWKQLSPEQKELYRVRSAELKMHGHNLFIREYMIASGRDI